MELLVLALLSTLASGALSASAYVEPILSQSQATGDQGQYEYSYKSGVESKSESRLPDGRTQGTYSYLDSDGKIQQVKYTAGVEGFQVEATNLPQSGASPVAAPRPQPVISPVYQQQPAVFGETPEVVSARQQHAAAHAAALQILPKLPPQPEPVHRHVPVHSVPAVAQFDQQGALLDTPEVAAARSAHAAAYAEALRTLPKLREEPVARHTAVFPSVHHVAPASYHQGVAKLAEEIPRSALGETPEVAAAREAHLAYYAKVRADLPEENLNTAYHH